MTEVFVIRTGIANLASVLAGLRKAGAEPHVTESPSDVRDAKAVVLPGVGAFTAGAMALMDRGLDSAVIDRVRAGKPLLAVCLGMQLLLDASQEGLGVRGLGLIPGAARKFRERSTVRVPQIGWNKVIPSKDCSFLRTGYAYFANSYRLVEPPEGFGSAISHHGGPFVAAIERGSLLACQFHPELSGAWGIDLLRRWIERASEEASC